MRQTLCGTACVDALRTRPHATTPASTSRHRGHERAARGTAGQRRRGRHASARAARRPAPPVRRHDRHGGTRRHDRRAPARGGSAGTGGTTPAEPKLVTSAPNAYWNTTGGVATVTTGTADVTVNDSSTRQTWEGFGGAFNEAGWTNLQMLSAGRPDQALQLLFDATDGAHFVMGRIPIGASDYALPATRRTRRRTTPP